ncbi:MAG TPA: Lrp/AsnC family transcriptional regulator [Solirubrobacteraceae bacterium]|jgi:DNA-binding Lrp family transcriptional regulator
MDAIDRHIIALLREDARASYAEVGGHVGLSAPAVKRRVDRLRADGVISGFTAIVDPAALGWTTEAFVEVICESKTTLDELRHSLADRPEIVAAYSVSGDADALLHLRASNVPHLEDVIEGLRADVKVARTRTEIVLSRLVERG